MGDERAPGPRAPRAPSTPRGRAAMLVAVGIVLASGLCASALAPFGDAAGGPEGAASLGGGVLAIGLCAAWPAVIIAHGHEAGYRAALVESWRPRVRRSELHIVATVLAWALPVAAAFLFAAPWLLSG